MRERPLVAGNWKMNGSRSLVTALSQSAAHAAAAMPDVEVACCPPFVYLPEAVRVLSGSPVRVGAQNCHWEKNGAHTGEVSPAMLKEIGCDLVILGHSERRHGLGETDEQVARKVRAALDYGLAAIVCVGETSEERKEKMTEAVIARQWGAVAGTLEKGDLDRVTIAYEPVWAIGTGVTARTAQIAEVHVTLRRRLDERFGEGAGARVRILYGGSVKPGNAARLLRDPEVDGALVGGASLKANEFAAILQAAKLGRTKSAGRTG